MALLLKPVPWVMLFLWNCIWRYIITTGGGGAAAVAEGLGQEKGGYEADRVLRLPGQPANPKLSQFSGYINVNEENGRALFYWFFEAQSQPSQKPLLLWLNGGPGCSSVAYGAAVELGPLLVKKLGTGLQYNKFAWNKEANLLFVESPVGVGFSYTNTSSDLTKLDDQFVAEDTYSFLVNWLKRFPMYRTHDFFIAGESYAGHYVPQLAELVYDRNKEPRKYPFIHLKGFMVGNPSTERFYDSKGMVEFAWGHDIISDDLLLLFSGVCNYGFPNNSDPRCTAGASLFFQSYAGLDIYDVYAPKCLLPKSSSPSPLWVGMPNFNMMRIPQGYDPCYSPYAEDYFNRQDVQIALHANTSGNVPGKWKTCDDSILRTYNFSVPSTLPIYTKLIKAGLRIWVYSGDTDGRLPFIGTRYCIESLGLAINAPWRFWYHKQQVAGRFVEYEGLTMVTVRGAGHLVPLNKPSQSLQLINSFMQGVALPTQN
ncbi:serine carboxypeptidase-like 26 [Nymphaea colorata]|nr:serine carboxypeptidase-like 26 [Nymphaea colorata]